VIAGGLSKRFSALHTFRQRRDSEQLQTRGEAKVLRFLITSHFCSIAQNTNLGKTLNNKL